MVNLLLFSSEAKDGKMCIKVLCLNSVKKFLCWWTSAFLFLWEEHVPSLQDPSPIPTFCSPSLVVFFQIEEWGHTPALARLILNRILVWSWTGQDSHERLAIKSFNFSNIHLVSKPSDATSAHWSLLLCSPPLCSRKDGRIAQGWFFWGDDVDHSQSGTTLKQIDNSVCTCQKCKALFKEAPLSPTGCAYRIGIKVTLGNIEPGISKRYVTEG